MTKELSKLEYRIRPVTRYVITRFERGPVVEGNCTAGSSTRGEYENADTAFDVAYALCKLECEHLGWPAFDERVRFPLHPNHENAEATPSGAGN